MDPSHIHRAGENPVEAIAAVISRVKHVHIRDCKGRQQSPGKPEMQANGRGDIDLVGYIRVLHQHGYAGPLDLEIIGAKEYSLVQCGVIAAESRAATCRRACRPAGRGNSDRSTPLVSQLPRGHVAMPPLYPTTRPHSFSQPRCRPCSLTQPPPGWHSPCNHLACP